MDDVEIIDGLFLLLKELDARERSNNCPITCLRGFSWEKLCDMGIGLFEQLKQVK